MRKKLAILFTFVLIIGLSVVGMVSKNPSYARTAQMQLIIPEGVKKENEFTVQVLLDSDVNLYSIDAYLSYNAELMEYVPDNDKVTGASGVLEIKDVYESETKTAAYEITFRALETGDAEVALTDVYLIDYADMDYIEVAPSAKTISIGINNAEETDARLSELLVAPGKLDTEFSPNQFFYEMHVGMDVEIIGISAIPMDEESDVMLEMPDVLQPGSNTVTITVTALSGNVSIYTITVYREDIPEETSETIEDTEEENAEQEGLPAEIQGEDTSEQDVYEELPADESVEPEDNTEAAAIEEDTIEQDFE